MINAACKPAAFLKRGYSFCLKLQLFLLEAGFLGQVEIREFEHGSAEEQSIGSELSQHHPSVGSLRFNSCPANMSAPLTPSLSGAKGAKVDAAALPTYGDYVEVSSSAT